MSRSSALGLAVAVLAVFSLLMSYVLERGQALLQPSSKPFLDWHGASWLGAAEDSSVVYLRKTWVTPSRPIAAWLTIAATDQFEVFLNGQRLGRGEYAAACPYALLDVSNALTQGPNVLAIQVTSSTHQVAARAKALLSFRLRENWERVASDGSFKVENRLRRGTDVSLAWSDAAFNDADWSPAELTSTDPLPMISVTTLPLPLRELGSQSYWIWQPNWQTSTGSFQRTFMLSEPSVQSAWLGVSTDGVYVVSINDRVFSPATGTERRMDVLDISQYLVRGPNELRVQVVGAQAPMRLAVEAGIESAGRIQDLSSDARWEAAPGVAAGVLAKVNYDRPSMVRATPPTSLELLIERLGRMLPYCEATLAVALLGGLVFVCGLKLAGIDFAGALSRYTQAYAAAAALLGLAILVDWDFRISLGGWFPSLIPMGIAVFTCGWLLISTHRTLASLSSASLSRLGGREEVRP